MLLLDTTLARIKESCSVPKLTILKNLKIPLGHSIWMSQRQIQALFSHWLCPECFCPSFPIGGRGLAWGGSRDGKYAYDSEMKYLFVWTVIVKYGRLSGWLQGECSVSLSWGLDVRGLGVSRVGSSRGLWGEGLSQPLSLLCRRLPSPCISSRCLPFPWHLSSCPNSSFL